jgi:GDP/UDP-N,N'-diacetylbacillosamine 2-epimerase (hydrolysing)
MKIGVLTSSRADYGIYLPLLEKLKKDSFFDLEIIAFGTHLSDKHGFTLADIIKDKYDTIHEITSLVDDDSEKGITISYGNTVLEFSGFWDSQKFDLVFCLGDRFEMSAAVQPSIPYGVKLAHIHGGETTLGAIDNIYRHQITLASSIHFTATEESLIKVQKLIGRSKFTYNVGSLSLYDIESFKPIDKSILYNNFNIKNKPFALVTFHPETISLKHNSVYAKEMRKALKIISESICVVVTMPNADTLGSIYRKELYLLRDDNSENVILVENFGKINYFSAMHYSSVLIGNTSSGIIEAASFNKYVLNIGDRQKGRKQSLNVKNVPFDSNKIITETFNLINKKKYEGENVYFKKQSANSIIKILKNE